MQFDTLGTFNTILPSRSIKHHYTRVSLQLTRHQTQSPVKGAARGINRLYKTALFIGFTNYLKKCHCGKCMLSVGLTHCKRLIWFYFSYPLGHATLMLAWPLHRHQELMGLLRRKRESNSLEKGVLSYVWPIMHFLIYFLFLFFYFFPLYFFGSMRATMGTMPDRITSPPDPK